MSTLWGDAWFYISAGGLLISSVLFVYLLGQYRAAVEAEDDLEMMTPHQVESEKEAVPEPLIPAPKMVREAPREMPREVPAPVVKSAPKSVNSTQELPVPKDTEDIDRHFASVEKRLERLESGLAGIKSLLESRGAQNENILKKISELAEITKSQATVVNLASLGAEPQKEKVTPVVEAAPKKQESLLPFPASEEKTPTPVASADQTLLLSPESKPQPVAQTTISENDQEKLVSAGVSEEENKNDVAKKGPVWPI